MGSAIDEPTQPYLPDLQGHRGWRLATRFLTAPVLRRLAWESDTDEPAALAALAAARVAQPCRVLIGSVAFTPPIAELGDDGRYHLRLGTRYLCARTWRGLKKPPPPALPHEQWCKWWSADGQHYRINPPPGTRPEEGRCGSRTVRWPVLALGSETDPALVRRRERCPVEQDSARWSPFQGPVLGPIIRALIAALGPACHACHSTIGVFVDHDPTGLQVRGLLCRHCNTWLETCPHPAGCAWGDFSREKRTHFSARLGPTW